MPNNKIPIQQDLIKWTAMGFDSSEHPVSEIKISYLYFEMMHSLWPVRAYK